MHDATDHFASASAAIWCKFASPIRALLFRPTMLKMLPVLAILKPPGSLCEGSTLNRFQYILIHRWPHRWLEQWIQYIYGILRRWLTGGLVGRLHKGVNNGNVLAVFFCG